MTVERQRQVVRADVETVQARNGGDLLDRLQSGTGLDIAQVITVLSALAT